MPGGSRFQHRGGGPNRRHAWARRKCRHPNCYSSRARKRGEKTASPQLGPGIAGIFVDAFPRCQENGKGKMHKRVLEPEVMDSAEEARDYDSMDHAHVNQLFVSDLLNFRNDFVTSIRAWAPARPRSRSNCAAHEPLVDIVAIDMAQQMLELGQPTATRLNWLIASTCRTSTPRKCRSTTGTWSGHLEQHRASHPRSRCRCSSEMARGRGRRRHFRSRSAAAHR